ncbi:MAG: hypothetical protein WBO89_02645, partial [Propionicimonas sp.]
AGTGYSPAAPTSASATIADNDSTPTASVVNVTATDAVGSEPGTDTITFTVSRTGLVSGKITVNLGWTGTATFGKDYTVSVVGGTLNAKGTILTLDAEATSATILVIPLNDTRVEPVESVTLTVKSGTGYRVGTAATATATISDDDRATSTTTSTATATAPEPTALIPGHKTR